MARPKSPAPTRAKRTAKTPKPKRGKVHVPPEPTGLVALGKRVAGYAVALGKPAAQRRAQFGWVKLPTHDGTDAAVFVIGGIPRKLRLTYATARVRSRDGWFDEVLADVVAATGYSVGFAAEAPAVTQGTFAGGRATETFVVEALGADGKPLAHKKPATRGTTLR